MRILARCMRCKNESMESTQEPYYCEVCDSQEFEVAMIGFDGHE